MNKNRYLPFFVIAILAIGVISPGVLHLYSVINTEMMLVNFPRISELNMEGHIRYPLISEADGNQVHLSNDHFELVRLEGNKMAAEWKSPDDWQVKEAFSADLNRDGVLEYVLLVWRPFTPWPIDKFLPSGGRIAEFHDTAGRSAHLILVGWDGDEYRELWAGSALANPISSIRAADIDNDGFEELIALEGDYDSDQTGANLTIWCWQGFGFTLVDRIEGNFSRYAIYNSNEQVFILTD